MEQNNKDIVFNTKMNADESYDWMNGKYIKHLVGKYVFGNIIATINKHSDVYMSVKLDDGSEVKIGRCIFTTICLLNGYSYNPVIRFIHKLNEADECDVYEDNCLNVERVFTEDDAEQCVLTPLIFAELTLRSFQKFSEFYIQNFKKGESEFSDTVVVKPVMDQWEIKEWSSGVMFNHWIGRHVIGDFVIDIEKRNPNGEYLSILVSDSEGKIIGEVMRCCDYQGVDRFHPTLYYRDIVMGNSTDVVRKFGETTGIDRITLETFAEMAKESIEQLNKNE